MWSRIFFVIILFWAQPLWANSLGEAQQLLRVGDYISARVMGESLDSAEGYALAAESLSAQILLGEVSKLNKRSKEARDLAQAALSINPDLYNAQLQYALADGFVTRTTGSLTIWRKKLPQKTFETIQRLRLAYPDDPRALALEGAWHLGVIRKTGENNGEKWFGASLESGRNLYMQARQAAPNDILIETNYALSLLVLDRDSFGPYIKPILSNVMRQTPQTHTERKMQEIVSAILDVFEDVDQVHEMAERFLDGK